MNKSKRKYKVYNGKSIKKLFENSKLYMLVFLFSAGIITGAVSINLDAIITDKLNLLIESYTVIKNGQGIVENFCNSLTVNTVFFIFNILFGFSLIGYPFIIWLPFLRGMGIGTVCGYLYSAYRLRGLGYSILIIYPSAAVSAFAFILACCDSIEYSRNAYMKSIKSRGQFEKDETKIYIIRQVIFLGITVLSSFIDSIFTAGFSRLFEI